MDERLATVLRDVDHINTINNQKRLLKEQFIENCVVYYNGGKFTVTKEFIGYINTVVEIDYIVDDNTIPVQIEKPKDFIATVNSTYTKAVKDYYLEYQNLVEQSRNLQRLLDL
jgi:hypothetical protein